MVWPISAAQVREELGGNWDTPAPAPPALDPLEVYAAAACERIEAEIGPHQGQAVTATSTGPTDVVRLPWAVVAPTSVLVDGVAQDVAGYTLDGPAGLLYGRFAGRRIVVTCTAPTSVPQVVELATQYLAATWVRQSKVGSPSNRSRGKEPDTDVLQGFAMPRRVSEMIRPFVPFGGFA